MYFFKCIHLDTFQSILNRSVEIQAMFKVRFLRQNAKMSRIKRLWFESWKLEIVISQLKNGILPHCARRCLAKAKFWTRSYEITFGEVQKKKNRSPFLSPYRTVFCITYLFVHKQKCKHCILEKHCQVYRVQDTGRRFLGLRNVANLANPQN